MAKFINFYQCSHCGTTWNEKSNYTCNDRCPKCDTENSPYESQDVLKKSKERFFLIKYTHVCGQYEFSGHTILTLKPKENIRHEIHEYFMDFYGENADSEGTYCESYEYNNGEVGVRRISYHKITEAQKHAIKEFNL